jgi:hypothetical protein
MMESTEDEQAGGVLERHFDETAGLESAGAVI